MAITCMRHRTSAQIFMNLLRPNYVWDFAWSFYYIMAVCPANIITSRQPFNRFAWVQTPQVYLRWSLNWGKSVCESKLCNLDWPQITRASFREQKVFSGPFSTCLSLYLLFRLAPGTLGLKIINVMHVPRNTFSNNK